MPPTRVLAAATFGLLLLLAAPEAAAQLLSPLVAHTPPVTIRLRGAPGACLELPFAESRPVVRPCDGQAEQQFVLGYVNAPALVIRGVDPLPTLYTESPARCLGDAGRANVAAAPCERGGGWTYTAAGELRLGAEHCLDASGRSASPRLMPCDGRPQQQWEIVPADGPPAAGIAVRLRTADGRDIPGGEVLAHPEAEPHRRVVTAHQDRTGAYPARYGGGGRWRVELSAIPPGHLLEPGQPAARVVEVPRGGVATVEWRLRPAGSGAGALALARAAAAERAAHRFRNAFLPGLAYDRLAPAAARTPDFPSLRRLLADVAVAAGRWEEAAAAARRVAEAEPLNGAALEHLATALDSLGAPDSAAAVRERRARLPVNVCGASLASLPEPRLGLVLCPGGTLPPGATRRIEVTFLTLGGPAATATAEVAASAHAGSHRHHHNGPDVVVVPATVPAEPVVGARYRVLP